MPYDGILSLWLHPLPSSLPLERDLSLCRVGLPAKCPMIITWPEAASWLAASSVKMVSPRRLVRLTELGDIRQIKKAVWGFVLVTVGLWVRTFFYQLCLRLWAHDSLIATRYERDLNKWYKCTSSRPGWLSRNHPSSIKYYMSLFMDTYIFFILYYPSWWS